jgi:uncharacterized protein YbjT (DUF2867 family)
VLILVTGATGTVGMAVVRRLRERRQAVRAIVRDRSAPSPLAGLDVELFQADLRRPETLEGAFGGVHTAFLLTPSADDQAAMEIGFIDAAVAAGIRTIVKHSAVGADASASGLANAHGRSERHLIGSGISYVIVRPTQFMQNLLSWTPSIARASALVIPLASPEVRINMVDVQDVADVEATVLSEDGHAGRIYTPSGPDLLTYGEVAERLSAGVGTPIPLRVPSADQYRDDMLAAGYPDAAVTGTVAYFSTLRQETTALGITTQDVAEVTGHRPRSVEDFALSHADSLRPA